MQFGSIVGNPWNPYFWGIEGNSEVPLDRLKTDGDTLSVGFLSSFRCFA